MEGVFSLTEALTLFRQHATIKKYPAETTLIFQGAEICEVLLIENGLVKMTRLEETGDENLVTWCQEGNILGAPSLASLTGAILNLSLELKIG
jgi:CRP-like cAMP-binding protein